MFKRFVGSLVVGTGSIVGSAMAYTRAVKDNEVVHGSSLIGQYAAETNAPYVGESSITIPSYEARAISLADRDDLDITAGFVRSFFRTGPLHLERLLVDSLLPLSHNIPMQDSDVMEMAFEGTPPSDFVDPRETAASSLVLTATSTDADIIAKIKADEITASKRGSKKEKVDKTGNEKNVKTGALPALLVSDHPNTISIFVMTDRNDNEAIFKRGIKDVISDDRFSLTIQVLPSGDVRCAMGTVICADKTESETQSSPSTSKGPVADLLWWLTTNGHELYRRVLLTAATDLLLSDSYMWPDRTQEEGLMEW